LDLQAAIDAPMFHTDHFPSSFYPREALPRSVEIEARAPAATIAGLRERGHEVTVSDEWSLGRLSAVSRAPDGVLRGAANPRGMPGYGAGRGAPARQLHASGHPRARGAGPPPQTPHP